MSNDHLSNDYLLDDQEADNDQHPPWLINSARGHADASLVLACAGLGWMMIGVSALGRINLFTLAAVLGIFGLQLVGALDLQRKMQVLPASPPFPEIERTLKRATLFELVAIAASVLGASAFHRPQFIVPLIALSVGLHFFPLAVTLRRPLYFLTGGALCAVAIGVPLTVPQQIALSHSGVNSAAHQIAGWQLATGLSGAAILCLTTVALLRRGHILLRSLSSQTATAA